MGRADLLKTLRPELFANAQFGVITVKDILSELEKPGRDPRPEFKTASFLDGVEKLSDLKPGMALGATAVKRADGKLVASEVHVFPPGNGIPNEGNRPMERGEPGATMTNATVSAVVQGRAGREMTLTYEGGMQQVVVPENVPVTLPVAGDRSLLVPGSSVSVLATVGAGNRLTSSRVQLGR